MISATRWRYLVLFVIACGLTLPTLGAASPASRELVAKGLADLADRNYEEALEKFHAAAQTDPTDTDPVFFQGVALNRLGRHEEALARLQEAAAMGADHPDLAFETGWSLLNLGHWTETIAYLERYELAHPGRGQTSEFLGRAYLALGKYEKAEAALQEAIRRDPALTATVRFHLALLERARGNLRVARQHLQALLQEAPESPLARAVQEELASLSAALSGLEKPWRLTLSVGGGYNTNAISLGEDTPLPSDISQKGSGFNRFTLSASYNWRLTPTDILTAGYAFLADIYRDISNIDLLDHFFYADYSHAFNPDLAAALRLSDQFTQVDGANFRNQWGLRPALAYRFTEWAVIELAYAFAANDYFVPTSAVEDRDGQTHTLALTNYFTIRGTKLEARLGYFHIWNAAHGADFDLETNGLLVGVSLPLFWEITSDIVYARTFDRYQHLNSRAGTAGFAFARKDDVNTLTIEFSRPIFDWLKAYVRYDLIDDNSNIEFYSFEQHVWSGGLLLSF